MCEGGVMDSLVLHVPSSKLLYRAGILEQSRNLGAGNRQATQPGGIGSLESILGLLKFKNSGHETVFLNFF